MSMAPMHSCLVSNIGIPSSFLSQHSRLARGYRLDDWLMKPREFSQDIYAINSKQDIHQQK